MKIDISDKILFLINLLEQETLSKNEIIQKYQQKLNINISKSAITNYFNKLKKYNIKIKITKNKNKNLYCIDKDEYYIKLTEKEFDSLDKVKKILLLTKSKNELKTHMRTFLKFALVQKENLERVRMCDFGYYSKINLFLLKKLEVHAKNKDTIDINYINMNNEMLVMKIHCIDIKISDWSNKMYLVCVLANQQKLSFLSVDKIFSVKKVYKNKKPPELKFKTLIFKTTKRAYNTLEKDNKEKIINSSEKLITIERPLDDYFFLSQRLLHLAPHIYYINDEKIKSLIKNKLLSIKAKYD